MASIQERKRRDGTVAFTVMWRDGGARTGKQQQETLDDITAAERFRDLVNGHGQQWPPGWIKGLGFVEVAVDDGKPTNTRTLMRDWAPKAIATRSGIDAKSRADYGRLYDRLIDPWFGHLDVADESDDTGIGSTLVAEWINALSADRDEEPTKRDPRSRGWRVQRYSPKYIANLHGLLYLIMQAAVERRPPLRSYNPCESTRLPRLDDQTGDDDDEMMFLEHDEFALLLRCAAPAARDFITASAATGCRTAETFAWQIRDLIDLDGPTPRIRIQRAWKQDEHGAWYLGPPKSKASRRTLGLSPTAVAAIRRAVEGRESQPTAHVFVDAAGEPWTRDTWYHRHWSPAAALAVRCGLRRRPRMYDLRHTHVAWLIGARIPLPAIQRRLGHESIVTTIDTYGHLVIVLEDDITDAIEAALTQRLRLAVA